MKFFVKRATLNLCLSGMLLYGGNVSAAVFGILEQDGSTYRLTGLTENPTNESPFTATQSDGRRRWNFGWSDLQPAFPTERFLCRNPSRPVSCLTGKDKDLPLCSSFENMDDSFVKVALTKSGYGDTPTQRGIPSAWSKMSNGEKAAMVVFGPAAAVGGVIGVGMAAVVVTPFLAIGAVLSPQCVGWDTKWVEFDHDAFREKLRETLATQQWDTQEARTLIENGYSLFAMERKSFEKVASSLLTNELDNALGGFNLEVQRLVDGTVTAS